MQRLLLICFLVIVFTSCQKEIEISPRKIQYPELKRNLMDELTTADFNQLDFSRVAQTVFGERTLLRIAFIERKMYESFVLIDVNTEGRIKKGRIIQLIKQQEAEFFDGSIVIKSLKGHIIEEASIINGFRRNNNNLMRYVTPDPYEELPEVVIVSTYPSNVGTVSWSTWYNLTSMLDDSDADNFYSLSDPFVGGSGSGSSTIGSATGGVPVIGEAAMIVDFEQQYDDPAIDVERYLRCFSNIPDAGATCTIAIYSDLPVDGDPDVFFNYNSGSPGHAFIRIEKRNGSQYAKQYIGLYPKTAWKTTLTTAPIDGKLVDNKQHEYNAYMEVSITATQLAAAINKIKAHGQTPQYIVDRYNCTDFALAVWNAGTPVSQNIEIPKYHIPGSMQPVSSTPQGLYIKMKELKDAYHPLSKNMQINVLGNSGYSIGPCN